MSAAVLLEAPERRWWCPNCSTTAVTRTAGVHVEFHACPGLHGFAAPMVDVGIRSAKVEAVPRQDYVGREDVRTDDRGRPIMAVTTTRDDGQDCTVYAPTAKGSLRD